MSPWSRSCGVCFCLSNSAGLFQIWTPRLKRDDVVTVLPISNANETSPFSSGLERQKRTPEGDDLARQRRPQVTFYHFIFARPFLSGRERHSSLELSGSDCRPGQRTGQTVRDLLRRWFNQIFNSLLLLLSNCIIPLDHSEALTGWWRSTQTYITRGQLFILLLGAKSKTTPAAAAVTLWLVKIDCSWFKWWNTSSVLYKRRSLNGQVRTISGYTRKYSNLVCIFDEYKQKYLNNKWDKEDAYLMRIKIERWDQLKDFVFT